MSVSILVPYRSDGAHRERNWKWVQARLRAILPDAQIITGASPEGPFNPSAAVNSAARRATGDVFIVHDADIVLQSEWYEQALTGLETWTIARGARYLTDIASRALLARDPGGVIPTNGLSVEEDVATPVGGVIVLPREAFDATRGKDPGFRGWGPEDGAWALALDTLWGPPRRFGGPMLHLWHPHLPTTRPWPEGSPELLRRYQDAAGDKEAMRKVCFR